VAPFPFPPLADRERKKRLRLDVHPIWIVTDSRPGADERTFDDRFAPFMRSRQEGISPQQRTLQAGVER
jgi:hypothetical protein